jgi:hypothetical protein
LRIERIGAPLEQELHERAGVRMRRLIALALSDRSG